MILSGQAIRARCANPDYITTYPMVQPFVERSVEKGMSYGLSVAGYDVRIREKFVLKPGQFKLASTVEHFDMPKDIIGLVHDKSTWARRGLSLFNTVIEPGWKGYLTLELMNFSDELLSFEHGMPIAQILFMKTDMPCEKPYEGKYQNQEAAPVEARVEKLSNVIALPAPKPLPAVAEKTRELEPA
jgi:dCTP deaminase